MEYQYEVTSIEGLVQLLACNLLPHGYWFYVTGQIPEGKDPRQIDTKLVEKYRSPVRDWRPALIVTESSERDLRHHRQVLPLLCNHNSGMRSSGRLGNTGPGRPA